MSSFLDGINEDDEENQDLISDIWANDLITDDVENMDDDQADEEENIAITEENLAKAVQKARSLIKIIRRSQILMMFINDKKNRSMKSFD